jgi:hypothetical protein
VTAVDVCGDHQGASLRFLVTSFTSSDNYAHIRWTKSWDSSVGIANKYGPTWPPIQWVPGALSVGLNGRGVKLTTHLHLVPRSNLYSPNTTSWRGAQLNTDFFLYSVDQIPHNCHAAGFIFVC